MEEVVLCAASAYTKKFYLNQAFSQLPPHIKNELKIMCVLFTEEIGSVLKVKQLQRTRQDLLEALELYYKVLGG